MAHCGHLTCGPGCSSFFSSLSSFKGRKTRYRQSHLQGGVTPLSGLLEYHQHKVHVLPSYCSAAFTCEELNQSCQVLGYHQNGRALVHAEEEGLVTALWCLLPPVENRQQTLVHKQRRNRQHLGFSTDLSDLPSLTVCKLIQQPRQWPALRCIFCNCLNKMIVTFLLGYGPCHSYSSLSLSKDWNTEMCFNEG